MRSCLSHILFSFSLSILLKQSYICRLEATLKLATDDKKEMELQISEFGLKLENLENSKNCSIAFLEYTYLFFYFLLGNS
jgi:hypothetical protein